MKINELPFMMIKCLFFTIIIEILIARILGVKEKRDLVNIFFVNIMTNPLVSSIPVYVNIEYGLFQRHISLFILEIFILIVEGIIYKKYLNYKKINPYMLSFILNCSSYFIGNIINKF